MRACAARSEENTWKEEGELLQGMSPDKRTHIQSPLKHLNRVKGCRPDTPNNHPPHRSNGQRITVTGVDSIGGTAYGYFDFLHPVLHGLWKRQAVRYGV